MSNRICILIILLSIYASSCKHQRHIVKTETHVETDSVVQTDIEQISSVSELIQSEISIVSTTVENDFTQEEITIVEYSEPDSSGNQHIIKETIVHRNNDLKKEVGVSIALVDSISKDSVNIYRDKSKTDFKQKADKKTVTRKKELKLDVFIKLFIIVLVLILGFWIWWNYLHQLF